MNEARITVGFWMWLLASFAYLSDTVHVCFRLTRYRIADFCCAAFEQALSELLCGCKTQFRNMVFDHIRDVVALLS